MNTPLASPTPTTPTTVPPLAWISLGLGVAAWIAAPFLAAIGAVITGHMARREIDASEGRLGGRGLATAGMVLGYVNLAAFVLGALALVLFFVVLARGS